MGFLKKVRWVYLVSSLILVVLGILCLANPALIAGALCYVAGVLLLIFGIAKVVRYFASRSALVDSLIVGVLLAMLGFILVTRPNQVLEMIFIFIGILVLLDGVIKMKNSFDARTAGAKDWITLLVFSIIVMGFGVIIVANPFTGYVPIIILGIAILTDGLQNIYAALRVAFLGIRKKNALDQKIVSVEDYRLDEENE